MYSSPGFEIQKKKKKTKSFTSWLYFLLRKVVPLYFDKTPCLRCIFQTLFASRNEIITKEKREVLRCKFFSVCGEKEKKRGKKNEMSQLVCLRALVVPKEKQQHRKGVRRVLAAADTQEKSTTVGGAGVYTYSVCCCVMMLHDWI